jgi:hypothetical protein
MNDGWTIDIDAAGDPADADEHFDDRIAEFERALEPWSGAVAATDARDHFGARFSYDTDAVNPIQVLEEGLDIFHDAAIAAGLPAWQVVHCEILTYAEDDALAAAEAEAEDDGSDETRPPAAH